MKLLRIDSSARRNSVSRQLTSRFVETWKKETGKKAVVITSRGGSYRAGTPTAQYDYQEPCLRHILAFVGLTECHFHPR